MKLIRSIISSIAEGVIKRFSGSGRPGESFSNREYFQHYGFTSRPLQGAEGIVLAQGNTVYLIASDDRRYRISLQDGEVALYTDEGDYIHFKRNSELHIKSNNKLIADIANDVEITAKNLKATATVQAEIITATLLATASALAQIDTAALIANVTGSAQINAATLAAIATISAQITAPTITLSGAVVINGNLTLNGNMQSGDLNITGNLSASGNIIDGGVNTNHHSHP